MIFKANLHPTRSQKVNLFCDYPIPWTPFSCTFHNLLIDFHPQISNAHFPLKSKRSHNSITSVILLIQLDEIQFTLKKFHINRKSQEIQCNSSCFSNKYKNNKNDTWHESREKKIKWNCITEIFLHFVLFSLDGSYGW